MSAALNNFIQKTDDFEKAANEYVFLLEKRVADLEKDMERVDEFMELFNYGSVKFEFSGLLYHIAVKQKGGLGEVRATNITMASAIQDVLKKLKDKGNE